MVDLDIVLRNLFCYMPTAAEYQSFATTAAAALAETKRFCVFKPAYAWILFRKVISALSIGFVLDIVRGIFDKPLATHGTIRITSHHLWRIRSHESPPGNTPI
jgi:hypothetical protein